MKKLLLIDGNSMLFRAYYATAYGNMMQTSDGIYTNAIFGFASMLKKALDLIQPDSVMVAFDADKNTYRYQMYPEYKGTRSKAPDELKMQFPIIREYLDALHITHYEQSGLEADDIIGCLSRMADDYDINVLTSDKDMLQLIKDNVKVLLMVKGISDMALMDEAAVYERFQLKPLQIIDLKGLSGDPSDNIPGVRKVGDKTAIKLLNDFETVENLYLHIDEVKGKLHDNLVEDRDNAFMSKKLATIITDQKVDIDLDKCKYDLESYDAYNFYTRYQMRSFASKIDLNKVKKEEKVMESLEEKQQQYRSVKAVRMDRINAEDIKGCAAIHFENENEIALVNDETACYGNLLQQQAFLDYLKDETSTKVVYDLKKWYHLADRYHFEIKGTIYDLMLMAFLDDVKIKSFTDLVGKYQLLDERKQVEEVSLFDYDGNDDQLALDCGKLWYLKDILIKNVTDKEMMQLYKEVELPLVEVLASMELTGIRVDETVLDRIAQQTLEKMNVLEENIYTLAGHRFNINSPKQLGDVIYDELKLARSTKRSTDAKVLSKLEGTHPIIGEILEYRKYSKLYSTYAFGLKKYIDSDRKIHTVFNQCVAETGRLSSSEPNLQNISVRNEETQQIRAAFIPEEGCVFVGADYSQVELRVLAHMANVTGLIEAFNEGIDVHTKTAMDVFNVSQQEVTPLMRRQAKAINFGIDYGMSEFGLAENLQISFNQAREFISSYFASYPQIREFNNDQIQFCQQHGYVKTIMNRRREIPEINNTNRNIQQFGQRAAMNAPVQGSAADLMKVAMINVYKRLKKENLKSRLILQIHDEVILNVPIEERETVMKLVEEEMENAMKLRVPLVAQASSGDNWLEVK